MVKNTSTKEYEKAFFEIISEIETINGGKKMFYEKNQAKILVNINDNVPLNKPLKFPTLTIITGCVFEDSGKLYPQIYLDECLYES